MRCDLRSFFGKTQMSTPFLLTLSNVHIVRARRYSLLVARAAIRKDQQQHGKCEQQFKSPCAQIRIEIALWLSFCPVGVAITMQVSAE